MFAEIISVVESPENYARRVSYKLQGYEGLRYRAESVFHYGTDNLAKYTRDIATFCRYLSREIN